MSGVANNVQGATIFSDNTVTGGPNDVVVRDLLVQNNLTIDGNFIADAIIVDNVTVNNDLQVNGNINTVGNINADGTLTADNGLVIDGDSYMNGDVFVDNTVFATDASVIGTIIIGDNTPAPPAPGTLEVLTAYGDADISGTLTVNGSQVTGPGGTATGTVQYRSATGTLEGENDFLIESAPKRLRITATTASTGPTSGSIVTAGGIGVAGTLYSNGIIRTLNNTVSTGTNSGSIITAGGLGVAGAANIGGATKVLDTTASTSSLTGALVVSGGVGIFGETHTVGNITVSSVVPTLKLESTSGSGQVHSRLELKTHAANRGAGVYFSDAGDANRQSFLGRAYNGGSATNNLTFNATTTGENVFANGVTTKIAISDAGVLSVPTNIVSTSTTTGSIVTGGGVGIAGAVNIGGRLVSGLDQAVDAVQAVIGQTTLDTSVNGTTSGTAYNIIGLRDPVRTWYMGTDGVDAGQFYFGTQSTPAGNPDYMYYYDGTGRFALLGLPTGAITAPTALFTVRGVSEMTGAVIVNNTQDATSADGLSGALRTTGGLSVAKAAYVGTQLAVPSMVTDSTGATGINIVNNGIRYFGGSSRAIKIQRGTATSSTAPVTVTFTDAFPGGGIGQEPIVTGTIFSSTPAPAAYIVQIHTITTTNFSFSVRSGNTYQTGIPINWIAMSSTI